MYPDRTQPNEGETLTQYYHRAYTADSLYKVKQELERKRILAQMEKEELERKKKEEERRKLYPEYDYSKSIQYFNPKEEELCSTSSNTFSVNTHLTYDKTENTYICNSDNNINLTFDVDKNGYRKWEIIYSNNKPIYRNIYTWYVNGIIESIQSYDFNTKEVCLVCHFFSDGKLRSAYKYGIGNSRKNVLRKSKESHPTFGGYTCKLYDLDGKYERNISWDIGVGFWGQNKQLAPDRLEFNKLKPAF